MNMLHTMAPLVATSYCMYIRTYIYNMYKPCMAIRCIQQVYDLNPRSEEVEDEGHMFVVYIVIAMVHMIYNMMIYRILTMFAPL